MRKALPFIQPEYFGEKEDRVIFSAISEYISTYNRVPTLSALKIDVGNLDSLNENEFKEIQSKINSFEDDVDEDWLLDKTEDFCKDRALFNAIKQVIKIADDNDKNLSKGAIPQIMTDALGVSFDTHIGHDYLEDMSARYDFYHEKQKRKPFSLEILNKVTKGGVPAKTLTVLLAGTGVGKTLAMTNEAAFDFKSGLNVLYITMEMAEERISERIDANLMGVTIDELHQMPKDAYEKKMARIISNSPGRLIVKEFPTSSAGAAHFRHVLNELRLKKNFVPDVIYIDYLNICTSTRFKVGANYSSYVFIKSIAEELRGLAVEFNVPIITATQTNRDGINAGDIDMTNVSESIGVAQTVDLMLALISTEELKLLNQLLIKQLKNRFGDTGYWNKFVVGIDRAKMKLYDVDEFAQGDIIRESSDTAEDKPAFDRSTFGRQEDDRKGKFKGLS